MTPDPIVAATRLVDDLARVDEALTRAWSAPTTDLAVSKLLDLARIRLKEILTALEARRPPPRKRRDQATRTKR